MSSPRTVLLARFALLLLVLGAAAPTASGQGISAPPLPGPQAADHVRQGDLYRANGRMDLAIEEYSKAIKLEPNNATLYRQRYHLYRATGAITRAEDDLSECIRLTPNDPWPYYLRAVLFQHPGIPTVYDDLTAFRAGKGADPFCDRRIADLNKAIALDPKFGPAYFARAGEYFQCKGVGAYERALADEDEALRLGLSAVPPCYLYSLRGQIHAILKGDQEKAIADFSESIRLNPRMPMSYAMRAASYHVLGKLDKALDDYTAAIAYDPQYGFAFLHRAEIYDKMGDPKRAEADRAKARTLPQGPYAMPPKLAP
jgi:tetratricopeptide (TPR) repeat protein